MIERIFFNLAFFCVFLLTICHGAALNSNEAEARKFLDQSDKKLFNLFDTSAKEAFSDTAEYTYDQKEEHLKYSKVLKSVAEDSRKFDYKNFKNEELKYAFEVLFKVADDKIIGPEQFLEIYNSMEELTNKTAEKNVQKYGNSSKKVAISNVYQKIFETSDDPEELQYYWTALRKLTGSWAVDNLDKTLKGLKDAAKLNGVSPLEFWLRGLNVTDMEKFVAETRPFYLELHAFLRNQLMKKYGESVIKPDGLIPDHLMEQVSYQILTNKSIIEEMFPYESLPSISSVIKEKFTAEDLYEIAEEFYEGLGFEKYPSSFWGDRIRMYTADDDDVDHDDSDEENKEDEDNDEDHTDHNDHNEHKNDDDGSENDSDEDDEYSDDDECSTREHHFTPNIYLEFCEKADYNSFIEAYFNMGYIYYAKEMKDLPAYFFNTPHYLEHTIGEVVSLSASTYHSLKAVGMIPADSKITPDIEMNRLFRLAIGSLLYIPINFVHSKVVADLLTGNVKMEDLNKHYWHLMEKYAGIGPPKGHKTDTLDLPKQFYEEITDNNMSSDVTNGVLIYQIYQRLCELSGKYPKDSLHLCDISGSKDAGNALKKMMQLGVSKPFYEILGTMFPKNPTVRTEGFLNYYAPIKNLLTEKNKETNAKIGWEISDSS